MKNLINLMTFSWNFLARSRNQESETSDDTLIWNNLEKVPFCPYSWKITKYTLQRDEENVKILIELLTPASDFRNML